MDWQEESILKLKSYTGKLDLNVAKIIVPVKAINDTEFDEPTYVDSAGRILRTEVQCLLTEAWVAAENHLDTLKEQYDKNYTYIVKVYSAMFVISFPFSSS